MFSATTGVTQVVSDLSELICVLVGCDGVDDASMGFDVFCMYGDLGVASSLGIEVLHETRIKLAIIREVNMHLCQCKLTGYKS